MRARATPLSLSLSLSHTVVRAPSPPPRRLFFAPPPRLLSLCAPPTRARARSYAMEAYPRARQALLQSEGGAIADTVGTAKLRDWWTVCKEGSLWEVEMYFAAGVDPNHETIERGTSLRRTALQLAAREGHVPVVKRLLAATDIQVAKADPVGRAALHFAAAEHGRAQVLRLLVQTGLADVHQADNAGDTALHIAARHNCHDNVHCLATLEEDYVRMALAGTYQLARLPLKQLFEEAFDRYQDTKLKRTERRKFFKHWVLEIAQDVYNEVRPEWKRVVTRPSDHVCRSVIARFDPDPDAGYFTGKKGEEVWHPTIVLAEHLVMILDKAFRHAALHQTNRLGRTALHEACYENRAASHEETIRTLVDRHVCDLEMADLHGETPLSLLTSRRGRPMSPTGEPMREDLIATKRLELIAEFESDETAQLAAAQQRRRKEVLADATRRAHDDLDRDQWELLREMSVMKRTLGDANEYEDPDTGNRFYRCGSAQATSLQERAADAAKEAAGEAVEVRVVTYSWTKPSSFVFAEKMAQALEQTRGHSQFERALAMWDMCVDQRHARPIPYYVSHDGARFTPAPLSEIVFMRLKQKGVPMGTLGVANEWEVFADEDENTFYFKAATNEFRWKRPIDAVDKGSVPDRCTRQTYGNQRYKQPWYTCLTCNDVLVEYGVASKNAKTKICLPCAKKCHVDGHKLQYQRISSIMCDCRKLDCKMLLLEKDAERQFQQAIAESRDALKDEALLHAQPPVFAMAPTDARALGPLKEKRERATAALAKARAERDARLEARDKFRAIVDAKAKKLTMRTEELIRERLKADYERVDAADAALKAAEKQFARREHEFKEARRKVRTEELRARPCRGWNFCRRAKGSGLEAGGWQLLHDPNEKRLLDVGDFVMCHKQEVDDRGVKTPAAIASAAYVKERVHEECYTVAFDTKTERTDVRRDEMVAEGLIFFWHAATCRYQWTVPRELADHPLSKAIDERGGVALINPIAKAFREHDARYVDVGQLLDMMLKRLEEHEAKQQALFEEAKGKAEVPGLDADPNEGGGGDALFGAIKEKKRLSLMDQRAQRKEAEEKRKAEEERKIKEEEDRMKGWDEFEGFRPYYNAARPETQHAEYPFMTGDEWNAYAARAKFLRSLGAFDEMEDKETSARFWVRWQLQEDELAALKFQRTYRAKYGRHAPPDWTSVAFSYEIPDEIMELQRERSGWALLRRRATLLRTVTDTKQRVWGEYIDSRSGEMFYFLPDKGVSQWDKPDMPPPPSTALVLDDLHEDDIVLFRFPGFHTDVHATVAKVRIDNDNGERLYDIEAPNHPMTKTDLELPDGVPRYVKWVKRTLVRRKPKSHAEVERELEQAEWSNKLARARRADERAEIKNEAARQAAERALKRGKRRKAGGVNRDPAELAAARKARARAEFQTLKDEEAEEREKKRKDALMISAMAQGVDAKALAGAFEGKGVARVEDDEVDKMSSAMQEARARTEAQRKEREAAQQKATLKDHAREKFLAAREDRVSSPRTANRRRVLRRVHEGALRQKAMYVICEWGCGEFVQFGQEKHFHENERCIKRLLPCLLGCTLVLKEEEWLVGCTSATRDVRRKAATAAGDVRSITDAIAGAMDPEVEAAQADKRRKGRTSADRLMGVEEKDEREPEPEEAPDPNLTYQQYHEQKGCRRRLTPCPRRCGEYVAYEELVHHLNKLCVKRPFPPLYCRLGCGLKFGGGAHKMLQCEEERLEHEQEICPERLVRCMWKKCIASVKARDRKRHRENHILKTGIRAFVEPGRHPYTVGAAVRQLKVQVWGAGGGSGHLRGQSNSQGFGGGGAFVEVLLPVTPGETLDIVVGAPGAAGVYGSTIELVAEDDPNDVHIEELCGVARGGWPGGGDGHGGNDVWAAGGGGGYSMVQRRGNEEHGGGPLVVAGGGGGGGSREGVGGGAFEGEYAGTRVDKRNGRVGSHVAGGLGGDSGDSALCAFPSEDGWLWQGGAGAQYGGGGGGGFFGGGGGGTSPGITGGGGGGGSYVKREAVRDVTVVCGEARGAPGGLDRGPPRAVGIAEWDFVGGVCGMGGAADPYALNPGKCGAVRIFRPGFYTRELDYT